MKPGKLALAYDETLDWDNFPSEKSLIDWCLGLVIIDEETHTVRLVHKSLHDYLTLLHENGEIFLNGHSEIAYTCLQYMCFNDDQHEIDPLEPNFAERMKRLRRFRLLRYATNSFGYHLSVQSSCTTVMINGLFPDRINLNCISTGCRSEFLSTFYEMNIYSEHEYISASQIYLRLQFAISFGLENFFINILNASSQSINLNTKLGGSTMLLQASSIGHEGIVRILLDRSVDVNLADRNSRTALSWAFGKGHDSVVKLLLQAEGVDINSKSNSGIDINSKDTMVATALRTAGRTALSKACFNGHDSVVKLLLQEEGIDIGSKDNSGRIALSWASEQGHDSIVKLLLQMDGIDINSKSNGGMAALSWASESGHDAVVKLLLQVKGIDINSKSNSGSTALSYALLYNKTSTAQLLLTAGAIARPRYRRIQFNSTHQ
ncbi:ankyrin repeat-containing domain protein [Pyronema domesticum]|nr:ankyrin repeat-containing domain protein [Pyronema domesticum]